MKKVLSTVLVLTILVLSLTLLASCSDKESNPWNRATLEGHPTAFLNDFNEVMRMMIENAREREGADIDIKITTEEGWIDVPQTSLGEGMRALTWTAVIIGSDEDVARCSDVREVKLFFAYDEATNTLVPMEMAYDGEFTGVDEAKKFCEQTYVILAGDIS